MASETLSPLRIAISSCLLGQAVRYDGDHKYNAYINEILGPYCEFVPICPEVGIGLGVPRPPLQLRVVAGEVRVRGVENPAVDVSAALRDYAGQVAEPLASCCGYIFKDRSPSCGLQQVPIHDEQGKVVGHGDGAFAARVREGLPHLPLSGEQALLEPLWRASFIDQVCVYRHWQEAGAETMGQSQLIDFHRRHKFLIQAHDENAYRSLGRLVAAGSKHRPEEYLRGLMWALRQPATRGQHCNVLQHIMGFFKRKLDAAARAELLAAVERYRAGETGLAPPLALIQHNLEQFPHPYITQQYYVNAHPNELALRTLN